MTKATKAAERFLEGGYIGKYLKTSSKSWFRRWFIEQVGYRCKACSISEWNGKPIILEINHKDGDALNNVMTNLEFLCPNCHSQTPTFRALNKKSTRNRKRSISIAGDAGVL